ncbi:glycoside hydrolase family 13 protein [Catenulispora pinisilvae]|uniref:glycoside hydrolase family 13 protein n=1 Tax=Catenulispora pinisilvae TaxID=2705253 RepID=UPI0018912ECB|nr:glycoside hydrolase family 13 protein [Catenulispora pinisilvae]
MSSWWRDAVIYQVYIRSFADGNGDGVGDVAGLRSRLPYLAALGVDALWLNPWYASPQVDAGYDVSDYRRLDPLFGTLEDAKALIADAHAHGLRLILDIVPNHTSDQHPWFQEALTAAPGSPARSRYHFRPGRGVDGSEPPTDWPSIFGGPAWTRTVDADGKPGDWFLHLFAPEQPDLNWTNPEVRAEFESILRFWLDLGVDGFRIDVAHGLTKDPAFPDVASTSTGMLDGVAADHPYFDRDETLAIYEGWRRVADSYEGERVFVAEAWVADASRVARYLTPTRLHTAFNFGLLSCPWDATALRTEIEATLGVLAAVGAPATWVLSNHDVIRHATRYGRAQTSLADARRLYGTPVDHALGERRARAAMQLINALPGGTYVYQGEELGLPEVEDLPPEAWQDPSRHHGGHDGPVRDGCRVPLPWSGDAAPFGFSPAGATAAPWLPQPAEWKNRTAAAEEQDPHSTLSHYRALLRIRREWLRRGLGDGTPLEWLAAPSGVLAFRRGEVLCYANLSEAPVALPAGYRVLIGSEAVEGAVLGVDVAVWLVAE